MTEPHPPEQQGEDHRLTPDEVADAPEAVVDEGVPGVWLPIVDATQLIPTLWRNVAELQLRLNAVMAAVADQGAEINAVETVLGVNPHGDQPTVADRLAGIEARLTALEAR